MKTFFQTLLLALLPTALLAHDTWLVPAAFRATPGQPVRLRLATSEAFPMSDVAASPDRIARFTLRTASGTQAVEGYRVEGKFLIADATPAQPGHAIVVAETKSRAFVLQPKVFNQYLQEEGLEAALAARARKGQTDSAGRERYRKIAKTILCVGEPNDALYAEAEGLWLEIVPERSPCGLHAGEALRVRVTFEGRPLAGAHLGAGYAGVTGHSYPVWLLTDPEGRATVPLDRSGIWFVRVLHMVAAEQDAEADWHSAFSTLTFEVHPQAAGAEAELRALLHAQAEAWNRGDIEGFMQGYWKSDRTTFAGSSSPTWRSRHWSLMQLWSWGTGS